MNINLNQMFKSIIDLDEMAIVICNSEHTIVYMNNSAVEQYKNRGGTSLIGKNLLDCHNEKSREKIIQIAEYFKKNIEINKIYTYHRAEFNQDVFMVAIRDENNNFIGYYEKFENRNVYKKGEF